MKIGMSETPQKDKTVEIDIDTPTNHFRSLADAIGVRNLMIAIVTMPLVFVVVVVAIVGLFGQPSDDAPDGAALTERAPATNDVEVLAEPSMALAPMRTSAAPSGFALTQNEKIEAMALDGDRLALRIEGSGRGRIVIYDIVGDAVIREIPIDRAP